MANEMPNVEILASHPPSQKRVQRLETLAQKQNYQLGVRSPLPDALKVSIPTE